VNASSAKVFIDGVSSGCLARFIEQADLREVDVDPAPLH
jgi:hypothetical protein